MGRLPPQASPKDSPAGSAIQEGRATTRKVQRSGTEAAQPQRRWGHSVDDIVSVVGFLLLGLTWLTLRDMDGGESRGRRSSYRPDLEKQ
jgi:hypothetical protein